MTTPLNSIPMRTYAGVVLLVFAIFPLLALATGANPEPFLIEQPNGTSFWARNWGDEWRNGTQTVDDYSVLRQKATGWWLYATKDADGNLVPSHLVVGRDQPLGIPRRLRPDVQPVGLSLLPDRVRTPEAVGAPPAVGTHRLLVIVVDFTPSASLGSTEIDWEQHFFTGGGTFSPRSVRQYWSAASYGLISLEPAAESFGRTNNGVVFVTLSYPHPNPVDTGDQNRQIARDAILAANSFVNFASFDTNGDGYLNTNELHVFTVIRGYEKGFGGEAACADRGGVWGHKSSLGFGSVEAPMVDGVIVGHFLGAPSPGPFQGGYMQEGEWHCLTVGHNPGHMATIGVSAHELGHDLGTGAADLYDTDDALGTDSFGIGDWGLMGLGNWNGSLLSNHNGTHPALPSPWVRWLFNFLTPTEITVSQTVSFPQIETATGSNRGIFQLLPNPGGVDWEWFGGSGTGEYFLVENRQRTGDFDVALPGDGLLIWHVKELITDDNSANADEGTSPPGNPRLVALEQADGRFDLECYDNPPHASQCNSGDSSDPWKVGTSTAFTDSSTPNSRFYGGASSGASITNISASGATMTALLTPGESSPPAQGGTIFEDDMESGASGWAAQAPWSLTTAAAHSPTHSLTDSPAGNYANDANVSVWSPTLSFSGHSSVSLSFWHRHDLENNFDFGQVWVTTDNGESFTNLTGYTGTNNTWTQASVDLSAFAGQPTVRIIFQMVSDSSITRDGWYIDDVVVSGTPLQASLTISAINPSSITLVQGGSSQQISISLSRTNYTGNVTLSLSGLPSGVSSSINQPGSGNSGSIILQAASTAPIVSGRTVTVTASGPDVPSAQATLSLNVAQPSPVPVANFQTVIPHSASGGGFLSRLFIKNLSSSTNALTINRISQGGSIIRSTSTSVQPRGTLLIADSESARTRDLTVEWFGIGSERPIGASVLFDFDSQSLGLQENFRTAVAALGADPLTNFAFPVRVASSEVTVGIALANLADASNTINLSLLDGNGNVVAQDSITLESFAQTAFSLQDRSAFRNIVLGIPEFIGSLEVNSSQPIAAMVIGNNFRELFSLPVAAMDQ